MKLQIAHYNFFEELIQNSISNQWILFALHKPSENIIADMCPKTIFVSSEECFSQNMGL